MSPRPNPHQVKSRAAAVALPRPLALTLGFNPTPKPHQVKSRAAAEQLRVADLKAKAAVIAEAKAAAKK